MSERRTVQTIALERGIQPGELLNHTCYHVPRRYAAATLDTFDTSVGRAAAGGLAAVQKVIAGEAAGGLISGPVGCGKSMLAAIACIELSAPLAGQMAEAWRSEDRDQLVDRVERKQTRECPRWLNVPGILGDLRRDIGSNGREASDEVLAATATTGLLVLDDLGADKASDWVLEQLYAIVATRYDQQRSTLATSNLSASQLSRAGYGRIVSRLAEDGVLVEMASAKDYRMTKRRSVSA